MRQVIVYLGEDGQWVAEVPSLPGCVTQGKTKEDAIQNAEEAVALWIQTTKELGAEIPTDDLSAEIRTLPDSAA